MSFNDKLALSVSGIVTGAQMQATGGAIAEWQLKNGMIPWFPGGHADPWNHIEAAMALARTGYIAEAERAYEWLQSTQREDGAWHQYYLADSIKQDKLDANTCAYVATGTLYHWLHTNDRGFLETMWAVVEPAIDFVLSLQTARGEILWARHADGTPWSFALLTGSSSICHSIRCAITIAAELGYERPDWELAAARLAHVIVHEPNAFAPKHRWAMDWYYPVLTGVMRGPQAKEHLANRYDTFVIPKHGVKCVSDRPWDTVAETAECTMAHLAAGEFKIARELFSWITDQRTEDGRYWTGVVYPQQEQFPPGEQSTYSLAAVVLAADALAGQSATSALFTTFEPLSPLLNFVPISKLSDPV